MHKNVYKILKRKASNSTKYHGPGSSFKCHSIFKIKETFDWILAVIVNLTDHHVDFNGAEG